MVVSFGDRLDQGKPGLHSVLGVMLVGQRIAEIGQHPVAHVLGDEPTGLGDQIGAAAVIRADDLAQILGIEPRRECRRADQIAEHHRQLAAFGIGGRRHIARCRRHRRSGMGCTLGQYGDSIQQATAMPDRRNPEFAQIVGG